MPGCSVRKCSNNSKKGFRLFCFPTDPPEIRKKWVEFCKRASYWTITPNSRICEGHFEESQFLISTNKPKKLKPYTVPTLFTFSQITDPENIRRKREMLKVSTSQSKNDEKRKYTKKKIKIFVPKNDADDSNDAAKPVQTKRFPCIFYPDKEDADKEHSNQSAAASKKVILQKPAFEEAFKQFIGNTKQHNPPGQYSQSIERIFKHVDRKNHPEHTDIESNLEHSDIKIAIEHMDIKIDPKHFDIKIDPEHMDIKIDPEHMDIKIDPEHMDIKIDPKHFDIKIDPEHMDIKIDPEHMDIKIDPKHFDIKIDPEHMDIKNEQ